MIIKCRHSNITLIGRNNHVSSYCSDCKMPEKMMRYEKTQSMGCTEQYFPFIPEIDIKRPTTLKECIDELSERRLFGVPR